MLFRNAGGISRTERQAFKVLADTLIFNEPLEHELSFKNLPLIAVRLQKEMIDLDARSQRKVNIKMDTIFKNFDMREEGISEEEWRPKSLDKTDYELNTYLRQLEFSAELPDRTFLVGFTDSYANVSPLYGQYMYEKWGFTPRLAELPREGEHPEMAESAIRKNCFGTILGLGSYLSLRDLKFDFAITADHPYLVVYLEKETYLASANGVQKMRGAIEERDGYKIYRPRSKDHLPHKIMILHDFDRCALYEILENMEMLRLISEGTNATRLPATFDAGFEVADAYKDALAGANWRSLASKLFPEITRSLVENKADWQLEVDHMVPIRKRQHAEHAYLLAAKKAQEATPLKNLKFRPAHKQLMEVFKDHSKEILGFLRDGTSFSESAATDIPRKYFEVIKEELGREDSEIRAICLRLLEKKFIHQHKNKKQNHEHTGKHLALLMGQQKKYRKKRNRNRASSSLSHDDRRKSTASAATKRIESVRC